MRQDNLVGIATAYGLDGRVSIPGKDKKFISSPQRPDRLWGQPPIQEIPGALSGGDKAAGASIWPLTSI
jgi:hypothetical protein